MNAAYKLPREERGMLLHYNKIIGGIRIRQERSDEKGDEECKSLNLLLGFYGKPCVSGTGYESWLVLTFVCCVAVVAGRTCRRAHSCSYSSRSDRRGWR